MSGGATPLPPLLPGQFYCQPLILWLGTSNYLSLSKYIYSQVAELGGTLGLFVGFSFLGVFDALANISFSAINVLYQKSALVRE